MAALLNSVEKLNSWDLLLKIERSAKSKLQKVYSKKERQLPAAKEESGNFIVNTQFG